MWRKGKGNLDKTLSGQFTKSRTEDFLKTRKKHHFKVITLKYEMGVEVDTVRGFVPILKFMISLNSLYSIVIFA